MKDKNKVQRLYLPVLILVAVFAVCFVSAMGYLNYRTSALELGEQAIARVERETVSVMETALSFGKSFENYYGMDEVFAGFSLYCDGTDPFVLDREGRLLYWAEDTDLARLLRFLQSKNVIRDFAGLSEEGGGIARGSLHGVFTPIHEDGAIIGWFGCLYPESVYDASFVSLQRQIFFQTVFIIVAECIALAILSAVMRGEKWREKNGGSRAKEKFLTVVIMSAGILFLSVFSLYSYQADYRTRIKDSISVTLLQLEEKMDRVQSQGVDLREVDGISDYLYDRLSSIAILRSVTVAERISKIQLLPEESDLITYEFSSSGEGGIILYLQAEISGAAIDAEMRRIILVLLSTMVILMVFVLELNNLVELYLLRQTRPEDSLSEKQVSLSLRFTGFLCSAAEYMCVPYAAMLIRDSGEALFGLSLGVTAALPLTMEGLTQMVGMLLLPRFVKKFNVRAVLILSTLLMAACNLTVFALGGALVVVLCRALAGIAYAGFKQVSNYLITRGYTTEAGRDENISQDNAGLLAGATCGAGLGAILSANLGYSATFLISAAVSVAYLAGTLLLLPWSALTRHAKETETAPAARKSAFQSGRFLRMVFSREILFFILFIGVPLNIGVMLCVTLIPAICQARGISSVMLSYCYIANGLAGIYIGPALVSSAKRRFGLQPCIAFAFALTAFGIFILHVPPAAVMIVITSMVLGFLDGFATPLATDRFMSLRVVRQTVDESTALVFFVVLSYVLLAFAPMVAELLLLPVNGLFTPMMAGAAVYAAAAVLLFFFRSWKTPRKQG